MNRRKFLAATGTTAVVGGAAGVTGQMISNRRNTVNTAQVKLGNPVVKPKPLPKGTELNIPGLSSFYTPDSQFYRVDTAIVAPEVEPSSWQLKVHGMVDNPITMNFSQLMKQPMIEHEDRKSVG